MKLKKYEIVDKFRENHGLLNTSELLDFGVSYYKINQLIENNIISKVTRGIYALNKYDCSDDKLINYLIPDGIICLVSSAFIYNYTTKIPFEYHVAIPRAKKYILPDYPPVKLYRWSKKQYELGMSKIEYNGIEVNIYDKEKTICDIVRLRSKIEISFLKEVLKSYLADKSKNLDKLKTYSKELRVEKYLDHYLSLSL